MKTSLSKAQLSLLASLAFLLFVGWTDYYFYSQSKPVPSVQNTVAAFPLAQIVNEMSPTGVFSKALDLRQVPQSAPDAVKYSPSDLGNSNLGN